MKKKDETNEGLNCLVKLGSLSNSKQGNEDNEGHYPVGLSLSRCWEGLSESAKIFCSYSYMISHCQDFPCNYSILDIVHCRCCMTS